MKRQADMVPFSLGRAPADAPRSPEGMAATTRYEGPHGPAFTGYSEDSMSTCLWGPHLPDARLDFGPYGRLDAERHGLMTPVGLQVGELAGEAVQPDWALFSRRRRAVQVTIAPRSWRYRVAGFTRASRLEREDGTEVATEAGVFGSSRIAESADAVDVAVAVLLFLGVPASELTVQK